MQIKKNFEKSEELNEYLSTRHDTVLLAFSLGKESICSWLTLCKYFKKIIPYYLYTVPDLEFINKSVSYYEAFFNTRIIQLPHPSLFRMLNNLVFQPPQHCSIVEQMYLPRIDYEDIRKRLIIDYKLDKEIYIAQGVRRDDSLQRRIVIKRYGVLNDKRHIFYPIFDWNKQRLVECLKENKIKLPIDYQLFGRSFDGIDYRFLKPIHDFFPADYRRIIELFPLAELELKRREWRERYYERQGER